MAAAVTGSDKPQQTYNWRRTRTKKEGNHVVLVCVRHGPLWPNSDPFEDTL